METGTWSEEGSRRCSAWSVSAAPLSSSARISVCIGVIIPELAEVFCFAAPPVYEQQEARNDPVCLPLLRDGAPEKGSYCLRILLHGINYSPELTGIGKYSGEMAEWLAARGHGVRVVTAPPYYPAWRVRRDYRAWSYKTEPGTMPDGVRVYRCPVYVPRRPSGRTRLLHLGSFMLSSLPIMLSQTHWRPDVVLTVEPTLMSSVAGLMAARMAEAVAWLHIQDFEVDAAYVLGLLASEGYGRRVAEMIERRTM